MQPSEFSIFSVSNCFSFLLRLPIFISSWCARNFACRFACATKQIRIENRLKCKPKNYFYWQAKAQRREMFSKVPFVVLARKQLFRFAIDLLIDKHAKRWCRVSWIWKTLTPTQWHLLTCLPLFFWLKSRRFINKSSWNLKRFSVNRFLTLSAEKRHQ